jgi:poly-gamma-glutamate capsule biosynthesis protein CapA/YwtB (metallophosphatase superfamily)
MSYSRTRTHQQQRSRSKSRIRRLVALNLVLFTAVVAAVVWFVSSSNSDGSRQVAAPSQPSQPAETAESSPAAPSASSAASAANNSGAIAPATGGARSSGDPDQVTFAFVGDILPAANVAQLMKKNGYDYPYRQARGLLKAADIAAGNLEAPITNRGTPAQNKQYVFRGPAAALPALKDAGLDVLTLANNHTMDYGWVGLQDTMDALDDVKLKHVGSGNDQTEAFAPVYIEVKGITVAFIGISRVLPETSWKAGARHPGLADGYNPAQAEKAVRAAKQNADLVVILVHWGIERADRPDNFQIQLGHRLVDAGADLVVGSHPHVLQGFESYKDKWIAYSLGNFVFSSTTSPQTAETGVLTAACDKHGSCSLDLHPMLAKNSQPAPMTEEAGQALLARLTLVSTAAVLKENGHLVAKR